MANYVLTYNKGFADCSVERFDNRPAADKAAAAHEGKEDGLAVSGTDDLKHFSMHELTELYKALSGGDGPSRFRDMVKGASRVWAVIQGTWAQMNQAEDAEQTTEGTETEQEDGVKKTAKKATRGRAKTSPAVKRGAGSRSRIDRDMKIHKLVSENPRKKGTEGYKSWDIMTNGMKVGTFLEKGGRIQDLKWDLERKRVELRKD